MAETHDEQSTQNLPLVCDTSHDFMDMDIPLNVAHTVEISVDDILEDSTEYSENLTILGGNDVSDQANVGINQMDSSLQAGTVVNKCGHITDGSERQEFVSERPSHKEVTHQNQNINLSENSRLGIHVTQLSEKSTPTGLEKSHFENLACIEAGTNKLNKDASLQLVNNISVPTQQLSSVYDNSQNLVEHCGPISEPNSITTAVISSDDIVPQDLFIPAVVETHISSDSPCEQYLMCTDTGEMVAGAHSSSGIVLAPGLVLCQYTNNVEQAGDSEVGKVKTQDKLKRKRVVKDDKNADDLSQGKRRQAWTEDAMQAALREVGHGKSVRSAAKVHKIPHQTLVTRINKLKLEKTFRRYERGGDLFECGPTPEIPSTKIRGKRNSLWTEKQMKNAMKLCEEGSSIKKAAQIYGIPVGTLHGRVTGKVKHKGKVGHPTFLTPEEECELERELLKTIPKGFNIANEVVKKFLSVKGKDCDSLFGKYGPGKKWWILFVSRHPKIAKKIMKLWEEDKLVVEDKSTQCLLNECLKQAEKVVQGGKSSEKLLSNVDINLCHDKQTDFINDTHGTQIDVSSTSQDLTNVNQISNTSTLPNLAGSLTSEPVTFEPETSEPVTSEPLVFEPVTSPLLLATEPVPTSTPNTSECEVSNQAREVIFGNKSEKFSNAFSRFLQEQPDVCTRVSGVQNQGVNAHVNDQGDMECLMAKEDDHNDKNIQGNSIKPSVEKRVVEVCVSSTQPSRAGARTETRKPKWSEKDMKEALEATQTGKLSIRAAARKYGIPHSTLVTRIEKLKRDKCYLLFKTVKYKEHGIKSGRPETLTTEDCAKKNVDMKRSQTCVDQNNVRRTPGTSNEDRHNQASRKSTCRTKGVKNRKTKRKRKTQSEMSKSTKGLCKRRLWTEYDMALACQACKDERYTVSEASRIYGIPRPTLYMRLSGKCLPNVPLGRKTYLTSDEENKLAKEILFYAKKGKTLTQGMVASFVMNCVKGRPHPFREDGPKKTWWKLFMKRHPKVEQHIWGLWQKTSEKDNVISSDSGTS